MKLSDTREQPPVFTPTTSVFSTVCRSVSTSSPAEAVQLSVNRKVIPSRSTHRPGCEETAQVPMASSG